MVTYITFVYLSNVSMFAGIDAVALVVTIMVGVVGVLEALLMLLVVRDLIALELVFVVRDVAVFVTVAAGIGADLLLLVSFGSALFVRDRVVDERNTGLKISLVGLVAFILADVARSDVGLDGENESDKNLHFFRIQLL